MFDLICGGFCIAVGFRLVWMVAVACLCLRFCLAAGCYVLLWSRFALRGCFSILAVWFFKRCECYTDCLWFLGLISGCFRL